VTPELRQLRYFVAVAQELNVTRAAARLGIAQQSLSQQIRALETQFGVALFERGPRGVELTGVGAVLLREARPVLAAAERAVQTVRQAASGEQFELRLGFLTAVAERLVPPLLRAFRDHHSGMLLRAEDIPVAGLVDGLREGRLDAALSRPPLVDDLASEVILREPVAAVLPAGHPLADRDELTLADLAAEPWVLTRPTSWPPWRRRHEEDFARAGYQPRVVERGGDPRGVLALVAAGVGVTRLPLSCRGLREHGVSFVPLAGEETTVALVWHAAAPSPALSTLREAVHEVAKTTDPAATG
jgi:DNA-binding transcriptional LysR family regulator